MKKIFCAVLTLTLVFSLFACGSGPDDAAEDVPGPTVVMDNFLKALKDKDFDALKDFYEGDAEELSIIGNMGELDDPVLSGVLDSITDSVLDFEYTLDNEQIDGNDASVDIKFQTYDLKKIMGDLFTGILTDAAALGISGLSQEEMEKEINEIISTKFRESIKNAKKDLTVTVPVKLVKKDGRWLIRDVTKDKEFINAVFGGLLDFFDSLEE